MQLLCFKCNVPVDIQRSTTLNVSTIQNEYFGIWEERVLCKHCIELKGHSDEN